MKKQIQLMKTLNLIITLTLVSLSSFSQTYKIYTAKANGNFSNSGTWTTAIRVDGVKQDKYIIPSTNTVTVDKSFDYLTLGDIQIEISGTLKMGSSATMELTNNSSIQLLSGAFVDGNGGSQEIYIGGVLKYRGNTNKTITGVLFADKTTTGFSAFSMLPVRYLSFTASANNNSVLVKWSTTEEKNNKYFELQKTNDGANWKTVAVINASSANSQVKNYAFTDNNAQNGISSYRLRQVDMDGNFDYSQIISVRVNGAANTTNVFANNQAITVSMNTALTNQAVVKVYNLNGNVVATQNMQKGTNKLTINMNSKPGIYVVQVSDNTSFSEAKKVSL